ncbi:hypothetical protein [Lunatimonas salinarum]|uniref:hypothetical protein n=1 Tax=Lunatimonas salinarum TaxID=1774590 RepID=UPI001ADF2C7A|nr:hypothetical protein [Lunatimonas salinarum]
MRLEMALESDTPTADKGMLLGSCIEKIPIKTDWGQFFGWRSCSGQAKGFD